MSPATKKIALLVAIGAAGLVFWRFGPAPVSVAAPKAQASAQAGPAPTRVMYWSAMDRGTCTRLLGKAMRLRATHVVVLNGVPVGRPTQCAGSNNQLALIYSPEDLAR